MYVESFHPYPGYAGFRINVGGRRYVGNCKLDGTIDVAVAQLRTAPQAAYLAYVERSSSKGSPFRRLSAAQAAEMAPKLEANIKSYLAMRSTPFKSVADVEAGR